MSSLSVFHPDNRALRNVSESATGDCFCFAIPALAFLHVDVGGVLYVTDICLLAAIPFLVGRRRWLQIRPIRTFLLLGIFWLIAQVFTDFVRQSAFEDYSRGWSKILLTITHFAAIALLIRQSQKRLILYAAGLSVGGILTFFIAPGEYAADYPWKFGLAIPVTILLCLLSGRRTLRGPSAAIILAGTGVLNLFLGFRSLGGVCVLAAGYTYFRTSFKFAHNRSSKLRTVLAAISLLAGTSITYALYAHAARSGWLGQAAQESYAIQSSGVGGVLLGGRNDILASSAAIADSPLLGHGSWAKDPYYATILISKMSELGYENVADIFEDGTIPSHSYLFGAWVESGIVGAVFWSWVLWFTGRALIRASSREPLFPFFAFIGMLLMWNVLFSPYGADGRFTATFFLYCVVFLTLHSQAQQIGS